MDLHVRTVAPKRLTEEIGGGAVLVLCDDNLRDSGNGRLAVCAATGWRRDVPIDAELGRLDLDPSLVAFGGNTALYLAVFHVDRHCILLSNGSVHYYIRNARGLLT